LPFFHSLKSIYNSLQYTNTNEIKVFVKNFKARLIVRHQKRIKYIIKKWQNRPITQLIYKLNQEIFVYLNSFLHVPCNISFFMTFHYHALNLNFNQNKDNNLQNLYLISTTINNKTQTTDQKRVLFWMNKKKVSATAVRRPTGLRNEIVNVDSNIYILISKNLCNTLSILQIQNRLDKAKTPSVFIYQLKNAITNKNNLACFVKSSFFLFVPLWNATFIANTLWHFQYYEKLRHNVSLFWTIVKKNNNQVISRSSIAVLLVNDKKYCFNEKSGFYMLIKRFPNIYFKFLNKVHKKNLNIDLKKKKIPKKFFLINFWRIALVKSLTSLQQHLFFIKIFRETISSSNSFFRKKDQKQNKFSFSIKISKQLYDFRPAIIQKDIRFFVPLFAHLDKPYFLKHNFKNVFFVIKRKKISTKSSRPSDGCSHIRINAFFALLYDKKKPQLFDVQFVLKKLKNFKNQHSLQSICQPNIIIWINNFLNAHLSLFLTLLILMKKIICFMPAWQLNNIEKETYKILKRTNLHTLQLIIAMSLRQIQSFFTIQRPLYLIMGSSFRSIGLGLSDGITFTNYSNTIPISPIQLLNGDIVQKYLNKFIFKALWLWVKKRHNNQSNRWIFHNYWRKHIFYIENNLSKFYLLNYNLQIKKTGVFL